MRRDYGRHRDPEAGVVGRYLGFPYRYECGILTCLKRQWAIPMKDIAKIIREECPQRYRGFIMVYGRVQYLGKVEHTVGFRSEKRMIDHYWRVKYRFDFDSSWSWTEVPGFVQILKMQSRGLKMGYVSNNIGIDELDWVEYCDTNDNGKDLFTWQR